MAEKIIHISGEIGWENTPEGFKDELVLLALNEKDTLRVIINSEGGSVFDGFDIYNQLKALDSEIVTEVRGMAASIASLIMLAGDTIEVSEASTVMIHRASTMAMGNSEDIEKQISVLNTIDDILIGIYATKTSLDKTEVEELLSEETWFSGEEAVEAGLADNLIHVAQAKYAAQILYNPNQKKMALADLFKKLRNENEADPTEGEAVETPEETTEDEVVLDIKNIVTREEFDGLVSAMEALAAAIDALEVEEATEEENKATEEVVESLVEAKFLNLVKTLKSSNGKAPKGNNSLNGQPAGYVDKYAGFKAKMAVIEKETRNK